MGNLNIENACTTSRNEPVGTTSLPAGACNLGHLDRVANSDELTDDNRMGKTVDTIAGFQSKVNSALTEASQSFGFIVAGAFADGFTITNYNQLGQDASGNTWRYRGATLPFTIAAGTTPSNPDYEQIEFSAANGITYSTGTVKDALDDITDGTTAINNLSLPYNFKTTALYQASSIVFPVGKTITTDEFATGARGGATYKIIAGTGSADGAGILANATTGQSISIKVGYNLGVDQFGAGVDGVVTGAIQAVYNKAATLPFGAEILYSGEEYIHSDIFYSSNNSAIQVKGLGRPKVKAATGTNSLYWFGFTAVDTVANEDTTFNLNFLELDGGGVAQRGLMLYRTRFNPSVTNNFFRGFSDSQIRTRLVGDAGVDAGSSNVVNLTLKKNIFLTDGPTEKAIVLGYDCQLAAISQNYFRNNGANPNYFIISGHAAGTSINRNQMFRPASGDYSSAKAFVLCNHGSGTFDFSKNSMVASHSTESNLPPYLEMDATGASSNNYASITLNSNDFQDEGAHYHSEGFIKWGLLGAGTITWDNNNFFTSYNYAGTGNEKYAPPIRIFKKFNFLVDSLVANGNSWDNNGTLAGTPDRLLIGQDESDVTSNWRIGAFSGMLRQGFHTSGAFNLSTDVNIIDLSLRNREFISSKFAKRERLLKYDQESQSVWIEVFAVTFATVSTSYMSFIFDMLMNSESGGVQAYSVGYQLQGNNGAAAANQVWSLGSVPAGDGGSGALPATTTDNIWWFETDAANETVKFFVKKDDITDVLMTRVKVMEASKTNNPGLAFSFNESLFYEY